MTRPTADQPEPPVTNRGVLRPNDDRVGGGVDYLKLTVWAEAGEIMDLLAQGVLDRYGWNTDPLETRSEWIEGPGGNRASAVHHSGSLQVVEYEETVTRGDVFCSVEAKGETCAQLGNEGIRLLLDDLNERFKIRASRVDLMAHTEHFTPKMIRDAVYAGDINSRSVNEDRMVFVESTAGDTCYLGMESKKKGGMKRVGERVVRVYDRRGPTRVELQLTGKHSHGAGNALLALPIEEWPMLTRGCIRDYCDFVDGTADERATRCPLLPWWAAFVGQVEKISVRQADDLIEGTPIGKLDGIFQRYARRLYAGLEAYGPEWVIQRIEKHGKQKLGEEITQMIAELARYRGTGLAGVPDRDELPPF